MGAMSRILTGDEITEYKNYNPNRSTDYWYTKELDFDFNDAAKLFSDNGVTPVVDNDPIYRVNNSVVLNFGSGNKYLTNTTLANRPLYKAAQINGLGIAFFDGVNDYFNFNIATERGGSFVFFLVFKNTDNTYGSHLLKSAAADCYVPLTGDDYVGSFTNPYAVVHHTVDVGGESVAIEIPPANEYSVVAFRRYSDSTTIFNGTSSSEITTPLQLSFYQIGTANYANWEADGNYARIIKYNGYMTDAQIQTEVGTLISTYN